MPGDDAPSPDLFVGQAIERIGIARKYRSLARQTVEDVVRRELERRPGEQGVASARETLHRVAAFYLGEPDYENAAAELEGARGNDGALEAACIRILERHVSTRERLPIMRELYAGIFARVGMPRSIADLAAACNPFSFRWMGLDRSVLYRAYDINSDMVDLVSRYMRIEGLRGRAELRDVLCSPPEEEADIAFLFKMYHCLEHRRRGAGWEVVSRTPARRIAVSFPSRNIRGRSADIAGNYRGEIAERVAAAGWRSEELGFDGEVVILFHREEP
jgi:16S rRNA (guanine(1405)-N(7))-methyltransferase